MTISKTQLAQEVNAAYLRGQATGKQQGKAETIREIGTRRFQMLEDTLINLNGLAQANAQLATAIASVISQMRDYK